MTFTKELLGVSLLAPVRGWRSLLEKPACVVSHGRFSPHGPQKKNTLPSPPLFLQPASFATLNAMSNKTYQGGCHCGLVRYEVELDLEAPAVACDCSICAKSGTLLHFVEPSKFKLERGEESLNDYQFNRNVIHHLFCKSCGIKSFARGEGPHGPMVAVNARALDGVDVFALPVQRFEGRLS